MQFVRRVEWTYLKKAMNTNTPHLVGFVMIIVVLAIWDAVWKLIAMWKSARNNQLAWFICLAIFNTVGILPIVYILISKPSGPPPVTAGR